MTGESSLPGLDGLGSVDMGLGTRVKPRRLSGYVENEATKLGSTRANANEMNVGKTCCGGQA